MLHLYCKISQHFLWFGLRLTEAIPSRTTPVLVSWRQWMNMPQRNTLISNSFPLSSMDPSPFMLPVQTHSSLSLIFVVVADSSDLWEAGYHRTHWGETIQRLQTLRFSCGLQSNPVETVTKGYIKLSWVESDAMAFSHQHRSLSAPLSLIHVYTCLHVSQLRVYERPAPTGPMYLYYYATTSSSN